jgi:hypothetical protein
VTGKAPTHGMLPAPFRQQKNVVAGLNDPVIQPNTQTSSPQTICTVNYSWFVGSGVAEEDVIVDMAGDRPSAQCREAPRCMVPERPLKSLSKIVVRFAISLNMPNFETRLTCRD